MNALDDIRIRTGDAAVTEEEGIAVLEWISEWYADCDWRETREYLPTTAELLRGADRHLDGGLAFVLADVRACATAAAVRVSFPSSADASADLERRLLAGAVGAAAGRRSREMLRVYSR